MPDVPDGPDVPGKVVVETERLLLRQFTADDGDLLFELDNDAEVMRYNNGGLPVPRAEIDDETLPAFLGYYERGEAYGFWAVIEKSTGRFVGWFHFRPQPGDDPFEPELGYRLHVFSWGRGYGTEGSRALIDRGFLEHGVRRVYAEAMAVNIGSRRVMEKAGMRYVRTFDAEWPVRIDGDEHGDVEYAIDRAQWEAARATRATRAT